MGVALVCLEFNRPGLILGVALGLLASLLATASIAKSSSPQLTLALLVCSAVALVFDQRRPHILLACLAALASLAGFLLVFARPLGAPAWAISATCAAAIAAGTHTLSRIAQRARRNKGLD
jgi:membrane-bound ClpP family serine protease